MAAILKRTRWWWLRWSARLGPLGSGALALVLLAALVLGADIVPTHLAVLRLRSELSRQPDPGVRPSPAGDPGDSPLEQVTKFSALLENVRGIPGVLARMHRLAAESGVALPEGAFKMVTEEGNPIARYQMTFPVKARYADTRSFVRAVLQDVPSLALDELSFRRDDANTPLLETRLRFTLFLRAPEEDARP